jgi:hypothetical protein
MTTTAHRQELNQLARVGVSLPGRVHEGTATLTFLATETSLVTLVGLHAIFIALAVSGATDVIPRADVLAATVGAHGVRITFG